MRDRIETTGTAVPQPLETHLGTGAYRTFLREAVKQRENAPLVAVSLPAKGLDPLACLEILQREEEFHYFIEKPDEEHAIAASGTCHTLTASGEGRFQQIRRQMGQVRERMQVFNPSGHTKGGPLFLGGFAFFDTLDSEEWSGYAPARFTVPRWSVYRDGRLNLLTLTVPAGECGSAEELDRKIRSGLRELAPVFELDPSQVLQSKECPAGGTLQMPDETQQYRHWKRSVERATGQIRDGAYRKIVLARRVSAEIGPEREATCILNDLRSRYPACYTFMVKPEGAHRFLGCTPERLAVFHRTCLLTEALAGSMSRGGTASEDAMFGRELMQSDKNREEHDLVVRDIETRLQPFTRSIDRDEVPALKKLSNVQHLYTPLTVWLERETDPLTLVESLHPTSAVGGYPWEAAAPHIRELEPFDRGWYAGPLGWMTLQGEGMFTVAIRSALLTDDTISCYAGCGIVVDSDPGAEWEETWMKLQPMLSALRHD